MMRHRKYLVFLLFFWISTSWAQGRYHPGDVVPEPYLKVYGSEQFFRVSPIDAELRALMEQYSVKSGNGLDWESLRYLQVLHRDAEGDALVGEMVCNASVADDLMEIFRALFEAGYPIEKMRLIDHYGGDDEASMLDNNTSCFNQRTITAGGRVSKHSFGLAVDINPKYNPYYRLKSDGKAVVKPEASIDYLEREADFSYKIVKGDLCYRLFKQHGFQWGGDWESGKDYQHFEK